MAPNPHRRGHEQALLAVIWALLCATARADETVPFDRARDDHPADLAIRHRGHDWPGFLGPTGDSKSTETGILTSWPAEGPRLLWQRPIAGGYAPSTVSQGRLLLFERSGDQARLQCLHAETGAEQWTFSYPTQYEDQYGYDNGPRCSPVVDGGRVYTFGAEGMLYCLRLADGKPVWKRDTQAEFGVVQNFFGVGSTPVVFGELLIAQVGGSAASDQAAPAGRVDLIQGNGSGIVAFDKFTGEVRYQLTDELASYSSPTLARIGDRDWCFVFARGGLVGFDPKSGQLDFHYPWRAPILESVNASNPVVVVDRVFISETYGPGSSLLKVRPGGYDVVWKDEPRSRARRMQTHWNTPIYVDGYLYGSSGRHTGNAELRCIELATGKVMWSEPGLTRSSLLYVDGHFVCLTEAGVLLLLNVNPQRFEVVAQYPREHGGTGRAGTEDRQWIHYPAWAAPILARGLLYVRGADRLVCMELIP